MSKQLLQEKGFVFSNEERFGLPQEVCDIIVQHGWEKIARHPDEKDLRKKPINVTLVKKFYAHFIDPKQETVYVRAERVEFTARAINNLFALKDTEYQHTPFMNNMRDQNIDFLLENLCFQVAEQKGVMKDETDFFIRGRQGIKPSQIPSLMGFDEDATTRAPPGGARTIAAARMIELTDIVENSQEQLNHMHDKLTSLFQYMCEMDEAIQSYFLELLPEEVPLFPIFPRDLIQPARKASAKPNPPTPAPEATVELDSADDDDEEMSDAPQPPAPIFDTSIPRRRLKRKANRNISMADLAVEDGAALDEEEDNGSSTTLEETPMTSPPQSKARYKGEMFAPCSSRVKDGERIQGLRRKRCCNISGMMVSVMSLQHWCTKGQMKEKDKIAPVPAYMWTFESAISSHERTPIVADWLHHSWAQNRQTAEKTKEEDILMPT
ncbi:hypothetical protein V6N11_035475 [Hibiscus sabdariffa]|uniref:Uncharacterized protein n=1 Tax=Hibiscus sabdariffa TaxID=183260 RepID=A0ABR2R0E9_9ROSI